MRVLAWAVCLLAGGGRARAGETRGGEDLLVVNAESEPPTVIAVLTSGDINAIYDEQILNPPPSESVAQSLKKRLAGWLPSRWSKFIGGSDQNPS